MSNRILFSSAFLALLAIGRFLTPAFAADEDVWKAVRAAHENTKTAASAQDFTGIIESCQELVARDLSDELRKYLDELLSWTHNRRGEVYANKAAALVESGEPAKAQGFDKRALADFEKAIEYNAETWKPFQNRGVSYALSGRYEDAQADFLKVVKRKPDYANAWFNLGEIRFELGKWEQAVKDYSEALRRTPNDAGALTGRGHALLRLGRFRDALRDYSRAVDLSPEDADALANRSDAYQALGEWNQAALDYRRAYELDNQSSRVYQGAAWLMATCPLASVRQEEMAVQAAERALELTPIANFRHLDTLAASLANAGRFDEAVAAQKKALAIASQGETRKKLQQRLTLYESGKPYRQPQKPSTSATTDASP